MNKKAFAALTAATLLFAGCTSGSANSSSAAGETSNTAYVDHDGQDVSATVTKKDGKITGVTIDETTEDGKTKKRTRCRVRHEECFRHRQGMERTG